MGSEESTATQSKLDKVMTKTSSVYSGSGD